MTDLVTYDNFVEEMGFKPIGSTSRLKLIHALTEIVNVDNSEIYELIKSRYLPVNTYTTEHPEKCLCGQGNCKKFRIIYNRINGKYFKIGSQCAIRAKLGKDNYCDKCFCILKFRNENYNLYCKNCDDWDKLFEIETENMLYLFEIEMEKLFNEFISEHPMKETEELLDDSVITFGKLKGKTFRQIATGDDCKWVYPWISKIYSSPSQSISTKLLDLYNYLRCLRNETILPPKPIPCLI